MVQAKAQETEDISQSIIEERNKTFVAYLESVGGKLAQYTAEILQDKLIIKSANTGKIKLELNVNTFAPLSS